MSWLDKKGMINDPRRAEQVKTNIADAKHAMHEAALGATAAGARIVSDPLEYGEKGLNVLREKDYNQRRFNANAIEQKYQLPPELQRVENTYPTQTKLLQIPMSAALGLGAVKQIKGVSGPTTVPNQVVGAARPAAGESASASVFQPVIDRTNFLR